VIQAYATSSLTPGWAYVLGIMTGSLLSLFAFATLILWDGFSVSRIRTWLHVWKANRKEKVANK
jgi:hypothetical protein